MARGRHWQKHKKKVTRHVKKNVSRSKPEQGYLSEEWKGNTVAERYKTLGLAANPNDALQEIGRIKPKRARTEEKGVDSEVDEEKAPKKLCGPIGKWEKMDQNVAITNHGLSAARRLPFWLSEEDRVYIKPLVARYGTNINAMFMDIKLNAYQKTKGWLKARVEKYKAFVEYEKGLSELNE